MLHANVSMLFVLFSFFSFLLCSFMNVCGCVACIFACFFVCLCVTFPPFFLPTSLIPSAFCLPSFLPVFFLYSFTYSVPLTPPLLSFFHPSFFPFLLLPSFADSFPPFSSVILSFTYFFPPSFHTSFSSPSLSLHLREAEMKIPHASARERNKLCGLKTNVLINMLDSLSVSQGYLSIPLSDSLGLSRISLCLSRTSL